MKHSLSDFQIKFLKILSLIVFVVFIALATYYIGVPIIKLSDDPEKFRTWIDSFGIFGMMIFVGMVFIQVIFALIPGEPLELVAGYAFGPWIGTFLCLIGIFLGSLVVFLLVRKFGRKMVEIFFNSNKLLELSFLKHSKKRNVLMFIVFFIPGTPKDLLCYFAGLTDIKIGLFIFLSTVGRLPSVLTSTVSGGALGSKSYIFAIIALAITLALSGLGLWIYKSICKRNSKEN